MKVLNREGQSLDVSYDEIKKRILRLCSAEESLQVDIDKVVIQTINGIYDGITTWELDDMSARVCAALQSTHYAYDILAAKITVSNMAKSVRRKLADAGMSHTFSHKVAFIRSRLPATYNAAFFSFVIKNADTLDAMLAYERDATHSFFALRTMERSYLMRVDDLCIESPQDMWMRVAVAINVDPANEPYEPEEVLANIRACYDQMSTGMFTHATPTLFNAGMRFQQCSSCYLLGTDDSLSGIFKTISDAAQISKWAGGIGIHVSNVRARGTKIKSTNGTSDGIIPMLKVYNEMTRYCNQAGRRKGSLAAYLEPWHADVWEFVELRRNTGAETERARDLFLALWVPDEFMERLEADDDWYLMSPDVCPGLVDAVGPAFSDLYKRYIAEGRYTRTMKARVLWQHILNCQLETGTPYILYKDHVNRKCNQSNVGTIRSSNLCAEITEYSDADCYAVCNLASIAVNRFVSADSGAVDHAGLHAVARLICRNLNRIIDMNGYPTPETQASNLLLRPIGIGLQGLGDVYNMLKLPYEDPRAVALDAEIMETIYHGAMEMSIELAERDGPYARFDGSPLSKGEFQFDLWHLAAERLSGRYDWNAMRARVMMKGARNSLLTALMPTASTSQILGNCECFEPMQSNVFKRSTLAGEFLVVNKHLMRDLMKLGLWDEGMRKALLAHDGSVQAIASIPDSLKAVYKTVWEVPQRSIIDHAVARGPFVCQSQSMNLFMATPSFQKLSSALIHGWRNGLKTGMYYLRSTAAVEAIKYGLGGGKTHQDPAPPPAPSCSLFADCTSCGA
jgi:ribonucleoside-diphosphate reductase alpha chain